MLVGKLWDFVAKWLLLKYRALASAAGALQRQRRGTTPAAARDGRTVGTHACTYDAHAIGGWLLAAHGCHLGLRQVDDALVVQVA